MKQPQTLPLALIALVALGTLAFGTRADAALMLMQDDGAGNAFLETDGDAVGTTPATFECVPGQLIVIA